MFSCDHCHTEYGGIRGVVAESCPRCAGGSDDSATPRRRPALSMVASPTPWHPLQQITSNWSMLPTANFDR